MSQILMYENGKAIGGEGTPTNASGITFDNTNTDLVSENVNDAIVEVNGKSAEKSDLTNLDLTGTTNSTGSTISAGTYFYLNGTLVKAKTNIANGATFTLNTNYEVITAGALNSVANETWVGLNAWTGTAQWQTKTVPSLSQYNRLAFGVTSGNNIINPIEIPLSVFKTLNSTSNYVSIRCLYNPSTNQSIELDFYYISDTSIGFYNSSTALYGKIWGIK